ncbi:MAG: phosphatidylserine decarboxylase [Spirochaetales bacterium]|jgi:phosphatidylserine decarboxylase|nr:phosphatidylserine decarboxylase [Spirochaetales bacterium]
MRIPLTKYGMPQVALFPLLTLALMLALVFVFFPAPWLLPVGIILGLVLIWMFSFFRDPRRGVPLDENVLLSPADGRVTDISPVDDGGLGRKAVRIGIFLSVFNVHINRAPCSVRIDGISYKKGAFKNALSPESGRVNESNDILMTRLSEPEDQLLVRQISGAIARHIVCAASEGGRYAQGERFGMIKFGSRTELYFPAAEDGRYDIAVKIGDAVRAGLTPLVRYKPGMNQVQTGTRGINQVQMGTNKGTN